MSPISQKLRRLRPPESGKGLEYAIVGDVIECIWNPTRNNPRFTPRLTPGKNYLIDRIYEKHDDAVACSVRIIQNDAGLSQHYSGIYFKFDVPPGRALRPKEVPPQRNHLLIYNPRGYIETAPIATVNPLAAAHRRKFVLTD